MNKPVLIVFLSWLCFVSSSICYGQLTPACNGNNLLFFGLQYGARYAATGGSYEQIGVGQLKNGVIGSIILGYELYGAQYGAVLNCFTNMPSDGYITLRQLQSRTRYNNNHKGKFESGGCLSYFDALIDGEPCIAGTLTEDGISLTMHNNGPDYQVQLIGVFANATCIYGLQFCTANRSDYTVGFGTSNITEEGKSIISPGANVTIGYAPVTLETPSEIGPGIISSISIGYPGKETITYGIVDYTGASYVSFPVKDPLTFSVSSLQCYYDGFEMPYGPIFNQFLGTVDNETMINIGKLSSDVATLITADINVALVGIYGDVVSPNYMRISGLEFSTNPT